MSDTYVAHYRAIDKIIVLFPSNPTAVVPVRMSPFLRGDTLALPPLEHTLPRGNGSGTKRSPKHRLEPGHASPHGHIGNVGLQYASEGSPL